jgi:hypothetical protein
MSWIATRTGKLTMKNGKGTREVPSTRTKRWPEYNKNMDEYITLDEAPQKGVNGEEAPAE